MNCIVRLYFDNYRVVESPAYEVHDGNDIALAIKHFKHSICDNNPTLTLLEVDCMFFPRKD